MAHACRVKVRTGGRTPRSDRVYELMTASAKQVSPGRRAVRLAAAALLAVAVAGCETINSINPFASKSASQEIPDVPAEELFNDGLARMQRQNFEGAAKKFADLDKQYPYSTWSKRSLILTAYARYENRDYEEAITAGRRFVQQFPADKDAAYAQYIVGMSYFNQIPDITRDQERTERALNALDELIRRWPDSEYSGDARQRVAMARDQLAGKEMEIGRFYLKRRNFTAAVNRFREVLIKYQTTRHAEESLARLTEAYMALGIVNEAQTAAAVLGHNFPDSQWYKDSYKLLQSGGLEPREDTGSWISRTFRSAARSVGL